MTKIKRAIVGLLFVGTLIVGTAVTVAAHDTEAYTTGVAYVVMPREILPPRST